MKTFLGLIAWCLVVYGPQPCINPYTAFGQWCLSHSGDWIYRAEGAAYDAGDRDYKAGTSRDGCPFKHIHQIYWWQSGWDDAASDHSFNS